MNDLAKLQTMVEQGLVVVLDAPRQDAPSLMEMSTTCECGQVVVDTETSWRSHLLACPLEFCPMCGENDVACLCPQWCAVCLEPFEVAEFETHGGEHDECIDCGVQHEGSVTCEDVVALQAAERLAGWSAQP